MRPSLAAFAVLAAALAALPREARAQEGHPDLTGTWTLQRPDSLRPGPSERPSTGGGRFGRPSGEGPGHGPRDSLALRPVRTLMIAQTDSTVMIAGERLPSHTYRTDGREERRDVGGVETLVRAWWDRGDLVIERKGGERTAVETYRLDEKGPRLIVIVEIKADTEARDKPGAIRILRIYDRAG